MIRLIMFIALGCAIGCTAQAPPSNSASSSSASPNSASSSSASTNSASSSSAPSSSASPRQSPPPASTPTTAKKHDDDHSHERDKMQAAHLGPKLHVWLTAHISSKSGNELDLFIETASDDKPFPLSFDKIIAKATSHGSDQTYDVVFEPAPLDERPKGEGPGQCSHYVAKCPWLKPDMILYVTFEVELEGKTRKSTWKNFDVKANTHHSE